MLMMVAVRVPTVASRIAETMAVIAAPPAVAVAIRLTFSAAMCVTSAAAVAMMAMAMCRQWEGATRTI